MKLGLFLKSAFRSAANSCRKHAPEILVGVGCAGTVVAVGLAIKETFKVPDILDEGTKELEKAETPKEVVTAKVKTAGKLALNYAPAGVTLGLSITAILGGHKILKTRHLATAAALIETTDRFDKYRERIKNKLGEEVEEKLFTDEHTEKVDETVTDPETGKEKTRKVTQKVFGDDLTYGYSVTLDRSNCKYYSNDWDSWMTEMRFVEDTLNNNLKTDALLTGEAYMRLDHILSSFMKTVSTEEMRDYKSAGVYFCKSHPMLVDLGLDRAQRICDFGRKDESEMELTIKIVPDIWAYSDVLKGNKR